MGYINSPSNVITIDTILTRKGRELLSAGKPLNITKFALSDDEIDYSLWNTAHPSGSDFYGVAIENLPLIEAVPDESKIMKYKLVTLPAGATTIPIVSTGTPTITFASVQLSNTAIATHITPFTSNGNNDTLGYQFTIANPEYFQFIQDTLPVADPTTQANWEQWYSGQMGTYSTKGMRGQSFTLNSKQINLYPVVGPGAAAYYSSLQVSSELANSGQIQTSVTITGRETGGSTTVTVVITYA